MNLKKGEIEINGILLNRDTDIREVVKNSQFLSYTNYSSDMLYCTSKVIDVEGYTFHVDLIFADKRLWQIQIVPLHVKMKDPHFSVEEYQAEKKKVCDLFLRKELGNPTTETEEVISYEYDWGTIYSITISHKKVVLGGYIQINYN